MAAAKIGTTTPDLRALAALHGDELHSALAASVAGTCTQAPPAPAH